MTGNIRRYNNDGKYSSIITGNGELKQNADNKIKLEYLQFIKLFIYIIYLFTNFFYSSIIKDSVTHS